MRLSRRDALAVLGLAGVAAGGGLVLEETAVFDGTDVDVPAAMTAAAEAVYPSAVENVPAFVETYVVGRASDRPGYREGVEEAVEVVDDRARRWEDEPFVDLEVGRRDAVLGQLGADVADPDPDGEEAERVRFYVVNELLYALYSSPTGGELVGLENPQGHPGGTDSYQRGP